MTLSSAGPVAPGDLIAKGSLVSVAVCLGKWDVWGLACDSCGVQGSSTLLEAKGRQPVGVESSCECDGVILRVLAPLLRLTPSGLGRGSGDLVLESLPPASASSSGEWALPVPLPGQRQSSECEVLSPVPLPPGAGSEPLSGCCEYQACCSPYRGRTISSPQTHSAPSKRWTWPTSGGCPECPSTAQPSPVPR